MEAVSIAHAREHLEALLARAAAGEEVWIADPAYGVVRLTAIEPERLQVAPAFTPLESNRVPDRLKGRLVLPARLMEPMTEQELSAWYGEEQ